jgi:hypothetical protein
VEEGDGRLVGFEFKYGRRATKEPSEFLTAYAGSRFEVVTRENYLDFVLAAGPSSIPQAEAGASPG